MYDIIHNLLKDQTEGIDFKFMDIWHICFIAFFLGVAALLCVYLKNKGEKTQEKVANIAVGTAFGLYVAELFLMPFAYGEIFIEKLPFHVCTAMCVACFFSRRVTFFKKYRLQFAMLGFLSNLTYLIYPGKMLWLNIHPLSYRVVQTLIFHGTMMIYGVLVLVYESKEFSWKRIYKDFGVVVAMAAWARLGNALYNHGETMYNWFFVVEDPFSAFPKDQSPYIMPFLNIAIFFSVGLLVYWIIDMAKQRMKKPAAV